MNGKQISPLLKGIFCMDISCNTFEQSSEPSFLPRGPHRTQERSRYLLIIPIIQIGRRRQTGMLGIIFRNIVQRLIVTNRITLTPMSTIGKLWKSGSQN